MTIEDILFMDNINNNNSKHTAEDIIKSFNSYVVNGHVYRVNNTIILVKRVSEGVMYFHTANADKFVIFVSNMDKFFSAVDSTKIHTAVTYFNNRKLKSFFYKPFARVNEINLCNSLFKYEGVINIKMFHGLG